MESIQILFLEDNQDDYELVSRLLKKSFPTSHVRCVPCLKDLKLALEERNWDLIISDYHVSDGNGLAALNAVRSRGPQTPFILVSGTVGEETAIGAIKAGADDYLLKDRLGRLPHSIERALDDAKRKQEQAFVREQLKQKEDQLRQAQKMEALGLMAGSIAHDFNNILAGLILFSDSIIARMQKGLLNDQSLIRDIQEIIKGSERASRLVRQLLAFCKRQQKSKELTDINSRITDFIQMLSRLLGQRIRVQTELSNGIPGVMIDPNQFEQIILNLAVNARDAMPEGGDLWIRTEAANLDREKICRSGILAAGDYVILKITDQGCGMDEVTLARVFEPFFTTKPLGVGTGLGLSTVYGIVQDSGGQIDVASKVGFYTEFTIYLPAAEIGLPPEVSPASERTNTPFGRFRTVLLAEDDEPQRHMMKDLLEGIGYRVLETNDGLHALRSATEYSGIIHYLITDVEMPHLNGVELASHLLEMRQEIQVILVTGRSDQDPEFERLVKSDRVRILEKPFHIEDLHIALEHS